MNKKRFTKKYPATGIITLDAAAFPEISQETIDREIRSFEPFSMAVKRLAEHEDAEEKCLLVRLPCKQGDYVYFIKSSFSYAKTPMKYRVIGFKKYAEGKIVTCVCMNDTNHNRTFTSNEVGKTVFLTREEAERALKEAQNKNE